MSGGGVGVGDRLDTLDTDLVKKVWSKLQEIKTHLCPAEHILITNQEKTGVVYLSQRWSLAFPGKGVDCNTSSGYAQCPDDILYFTDYLQTKWGKM